MKMEVRDAVDLHNFICGGGRAGNDRQFNRKAQNVAKSINDQIDEVKA